MRTLRTSPFEVHSKEHENMLRSPGNLSSENCYQVYNQIITQKGIIFYWERAKFKQNAKKTIHLSIPALSHT